MLEKFNTKIIIYGVVFILIIIIIMSGVFIFNQHNQKRDIKPEIKNFYRLKVGMDYDKVKSLVGEPSKILGSGISVFYAVYNRPDGSLINICYDYKSGRLQSIEYVDKGGTREMIIQ